VRRLVIDAVRTAVALLEVQLLRLVAVAAVALAELRAVQALVRRVARVGSVDAETLEVVLVVLVIGTLVGGVVISTARSTHVCGTFHSPYGQRTSLRKLGFCKAYCVQGEISSRARAHTLTLYDNAHAIFSLQMWSSL
jgi:hypothetical protein